VARNQKNFKYFKYVDDNAFEWCLRGESGGAFNAVDGNAAFDASKPVFGRITTKRHPRYIIAQDSVTFRTVKGIMYTAAAYAALVGGATVAVTVPGLSTTVNYNVIAKIGEKLPIGRTARNLADS
jgi:hypothetical protein